MPRPPRSRRARLAGARLTDRRMAAYRWVAERRKNFPAVQNLERKQREEAERRERGELGPPG